MCLLFHDFLKPFPKLETILVGRAHNTVGHIKTCVQRIDVGIAELYSLPMGSKTNSCKCTCWWYCWTVEGAKRKRNHQLILTQVLIELTNPNAVSGALNKRAYLAWKIKSQSIPDIQSAQWHPNCQVIMCCNPFPNWHKQWCDQKIVSSYPIKWWWHCKSEVFWIASSSQRSDFFAVWFLNAPQQGLQLQ